MRTRLVAVSFALALAASVPAQEAEPPAAAGPGRTAEPQQPAPPDRTRAGAKPVIVTATRLDADPFELPYSTDSLDYDERVVVRQFRTIPESLRELPGISVQKTAHGQGSPKFRGQTGFQTLLLVDGIRINDSTWRVGNVEYWNHLDPYAYGRFEIVRGPAAVVWGSDAVSGVGHAFSKLPSLRVPGLNLGGSALFRYASAEDSVVSHFEHNGNLDDFGWHLGATYKDYGDLQAGRDVGLLPNTGYEDADFDVSLRWRLGDREHLTAAVQHANLRDVPRTHSTVRNVAWRGITAGTDLERKHTHRRWLSYLKYEVADAFFDTASLTVAHKHRYERESRLRSGNRRTFNQLDVDTLAIAGQGEKATDFGNVLVGFDWYHDIIDSEARDHDAAGNLTSSQPRGTVAGDADYDLLGVFVQDEIGVGEQTDLLAGVRWQYTNLSADDVAVPGITAIDHVSDHWHSVTGNIRALHRFGRDWRLFGGASQSFRAPNLSDTTRFDIGRTGEQEIPATGLSPEHYTTFEVGARYDDGVRAAAVTGWYTLVEDQIGRFRTGGTSGSGNPLVSKGNIGDGFYTGVEVEGSLQLDSICACLDGWALHGFADYVDGRIDQVLASGRMIRDRPGALPPVSGLVGLRWDDPRERAGFEFFARMAYLVKPSRYTESDAANTSRIPPDGLPGWVVYGIRAHYRLAATVTVSGAIENLTGVDYRIMDSGLQEPGTNAIVTVQTVF